jgi:hypothetical protein
MRAVGRPVTTLSGYAPALPTPFRENGAIDFAAFERFCEVQIAGGAAALVVCGTTGEAPTLSPEEQRELVGFAVKVVRGRVPVIAGAGSNSTAHAVELTRDAEAAGADAILSAPQPACPWFSTMFPRARSAALPTRRLRASRRTRGSQASRMQPATSHGLHD